MTLARELETAHETAQNELDALVNEISGMDARVLGLGAPKNFTRRHHASSYIWLAATLERVIPEVLSALVGLIESSGAACRDLRPELLVVVAGGELTALQDVRGRKMWEKRLDLMRLARAPQPVSLPYAHLPLDGRTIRPDHFDLFWEVFGLYGPSLPTLSHRAALTEIADLRNDLAHGAISPARVGALKTRAEILHRIGQTGEIIEHFVLSAQDCVDNGRYLAVP